MAKQEEIFEFLQERIPRDKLLLASKEELAEFVRQQQDVIVQLQNHVRSLEKLNGEARQRILWVEEQAIVLKNKIFGRSSERLPSNSDPSEKKPKGKKVRVLLPSERYPEAPLIERRVEFQSIPSCNCCGAEMMDTGMTEDSEFLTTIPQQYLVIRQMRQKVSCGKCHGDMRTAPSPPRIKAGSSYSDEMMIDVAMTKYCDLVPIERYAAIAGREGLEDLPANSLIESTHYLADFVTGAYEKLKDEVIASRVLHADETPHRMLEGDKKKSWYLWGFSTDKASYYECHNTRSGDVATGLLASARCEYLVSDVYSGYAKAVRESNERRQGQGQPLVRSLYCNAHARRKFKEAADVYPEEAQYFLEKYQKIYLLVEEMKARPPDEQLEVTKKMAVAFAEMRAAAVEATVGYSLKSSIVKAMGYFVENYVGLTEFLSHPGLPIDNNPQERLMRNPVLGRKTWYGTHSKQGAKTSAILFSLVESCKLNKVNPREYFKKLVDEIHGGKAPITPSHFAAN